MRIDVGAPVGEQRTGDRHEHPLRELDDAYALECTVAQLADLLGCVRSSERRNRVTRVRWTKA